MHFLAMSSKIYVSAIEFIKCVEESISFVTLANCIAMKAILNLYCYLRMRSLKEELHWATTRVSPLQSIPPLSQLC